MIKQNKLEYNKVGILNFKLVNFTLKTILFKAQQISKQNTIVSMKTSSNLDAFLKQVKSSNYYCQPINISLKFQNLEQISIKLPPSKDHQLIAKFPQIKFTLSDQIVSKINQDISRSKKTRNGLIAAYENVKFKHRMQKIHHFSQNDQDDIGVWQQAQDAFCVGFIVQKQGNYDQFKKRVTVQLKKCLQKKLQQVVYAKNTQPQDSLSELNPIQKILYKHFRFFLIYEPSSPNSLIVNRIMYYPDAKFLIKPIKLVPSKFTANKTYEQVLTFKTKYDYGYLSLSNNSKTKQIRFLLIDKFDPQLNQSPPPMIGVWLSAQKFQSKQELKNYSWAVIMEYLRNPSLKIKLSINYQNTGIIFTIERPQKITAYIFEIIDQPKWNLKYSSQNTFRLPQDYVFNDQQVIVQEDKQQSDIESIQNRSIMKNNQFLNNYLPQNSYPTNINTNSGIAQSCDLSKSSVENKSVKSNDEKDLQIKFLKKQLEFYKNRCEMLQKMLNNPAMMQIQAMQMMNPLANPLTNPLAFNNNLMYQSLQPNNFPNPQMNFMQSNLNPTMNLMNNNIQSNFQQSQTLYQSRASTNIQKILNQSDLYDEEMQKVPQPLPINKQLAFNKKKTFQEENTLNFQGQKTKLKSKQSLQNPIQSSSQNQKQAPIQLGQFPSQEDIQMSPDGKKHYFQYDYKNISFQDNSFENQLNSTHKFGVFDANESQIFVKSPDFKTFNFNNNISEKQNDFKVTDQGNKKRNSNHAKDFSFDRKEEDFMSSKNSRQSPQKPQTNYINRNQAKRNDSEDSDRQDRKFMSKFQMKYSQEFGQGNKVQQKKTILRKQTTKQSYHYKDKYEQLDSAKKQNFRDQKFTSQSLTNKSQQKIDEKSQKLRAYERQLPLEQKKTQAIDKQVRQKYSYGNDRSKAIEQSKPLRKQNQIKRDQDLPVSRINRNQGLSKTRQVVENSDSDSDEQLRNIALKYRK